MSRFIVVVVVGLVGQTAYGQAGAEVVSFKVTVDGDGTVVDVPGGNFVLTDVVTTVSDYALTIESGGVEQVYFEFDSSPPINTYHFRSGIALEGSTMILSTNGSIENVTLSGYLPCPPCATVPAVGSFGLLVMTVIVLGAGACVLRRRRAAA